MLTRKQEYEYEPSRRCARGLYLALGLSLGLIAGTCVELATSDEPAPVQHVASDTEIASEAAQTAMMTDFVVKNLVQKAETAAENLDVAGCQKYVENLRELAPWMALGIDCEL